MLRMKTTLKAVGFCLVFVCSYAFAQGHPSFVPQDCGQYDCVNLQNLTVSLNIPVMSKSGAFPFNAALVGGDSYFSYNGTNLQPGILAQPITPQIDGILSPFGYAQVLYGHTYTGSACPSGDGTGSFVQYLGLYLQMPDGTVHALPSTDSVYTPGTGSTCHTMLSDQVIDGTGWTVALNGSTYNPADQAGVTVVSSGGMTVSAALNSLTLEDAQSTPNEITYSVSQQTFTDTLGMAALTVNANAAGQLGWFDTLGNNPSESQTFLVGSNAMLKTSFGCSGKADYPATSYAAGLTTQITFPDTSTIGLTWEPNEVTTADYTGRLASITERSGGVITFNYNPGGATSAPYGLNCTNLVPNSLTRATTDGTVTYNWASLSGGGSTTTKLDIGQNKTVYTFSASGIITEIQTFLNRGSISAPLYASPATNTVTYCYDAGPTPTVSSCPTASVYEPVTQLAVFTSPNGLSPSESYQTFDSYGNVTYSAQYDFGGSSPMVATTNTMAVSGSGNCSAIENSINNKICSSTTSILGNTVGASKFTYSAQGNLLATLYSPNGGSSFVGCTASWNTYRANGEPTAIYDANCNLTVLTYSCSSTYYSPVVPTYCPFATERTKGGLSTYSHWNSYGGVKTEDVDANGNVTLYCYNNTAGTSCNGSVADPWSRVMAIVDPLNNEVFKTYSPTGLTTDFSFNAGNSVKNATTTLDGYGRPINVQKQQGPSASNWDTASTFRSFSSVLPSTQTTNPCSQTLGAQCGTTYGPTVSGAVLTGGLFESITTQSGSNAVTKTTYNEGDVTSILSPAPSGENTKGVENEYNGAGWLTSSCAISSVVSGEVSCGQRTGSHSGILTTVSYSSASGSLTVKSCRGPSNQQCRTTVTDGLGRVTSKTTPEGGTWSYYYDTAPSACAGASASAGNLTCVKDPNGNVINYFYDSNNRVIEVNADGTTCRWFYYDNSSGYLGTLPTGVSLSNQYGRMVEGATDNCQSTKSSATLLTDLWWNYDADGRPLTEWEQTPNSTQYYESTATFYGNGAPDVVTLAIPSLYSMTYGLDGEGRPSSLKDNASTDVYSTTFNPAGEPLVISLFGASADNDTYVYDPNTLLMTSYDFTVNSVSDTGTLSWNPNNTLAELSISDGFNSGGSLTCGFNNGVVSGTGYDDLARLIAWSCTSSAGTWAQTETLDQYDNLTKASTGLSSWNPTYSATTNHYACSGCANDSNGNVTNDGSSVYTWNEFSKMKTVLPSGGSASTPIYDALGRMVETGASGGNREIWYTQAGKVFMSGTTVDYGYWPSPGGGTMLENGNAANQYYMHKDWVENARVVSNGGHAIMTDRAIAPYGEIFNIYTSSQQNYGMFAGITQDLLSGMYDTPNRELPATQSRFLSPDPAGSGWNQYGYPTNPNSESDPSGLQGQSGGGCPVLFCNRGSGAMGSDNTTYIVDGLQMDWNPYADAPDALQAISYGSVIADGNSSWTILSDSSCPSAGPPCQAPSANCFGSICYAADGSIIDAGQAGQMMATFGQPIGCGNATVCVVAAPFDDDPLGDEFRALNATLLAAVNSALDQLSNPTPLSVIIRVTNQELAQEAHEKQLNQQTWYQLGPAGDPNWYPTLGPYGDGFPGSPSTQPMNPVLSNCTTYWGMYMEDLDITSSDCSY
jgi:RHS repeat-associated protein